MLERWRELLRRSICSVAVLLLSLAYVATAFVTIDRTGKSVAQIVADGAVVFLMGVLVNRLFDAQGILNGERDARVAEAVARHAAAAERLSPAADVLDAWCDQRNATALRRARRQYLARRGMRYEDCFDEADLPRPFVRRRMHGLRERIAEARRHWRHRRAARLRLTELSAALLLGEAGSAADPFSLGRSKREYLRQSSKADVLTKLGTAFLFGYYGVSLLQELRLAGLIWTVLQVAFLIGTGILKMQRSYLFVTDEYRGRVLQKLGLLQRFEMEWKAEEGGHNDNETNADGDDGRDGGAERTGKLPQAQSRPGGAL